MKKPMIEIFGEKEQLANAMAESFISRVQVLLKSKNEIFLAFSGGTTPLLFFRRLASLSSIETGKTEWNRIHFFWCDERCVPPSHPDSNYGAMYPLLLFPKKVPETNIHRIHGEDDPFIESTRYADEIRAKVPVKNDFPVFDMVFLGVGDDGHTASIFPDQMNILYSDKISETARHPSTGQYRITLTGKVLNNAGYVAFLVSGESKKEIIRQIIQNEPAAKKYPAYFIKPVTVEWFLDSDAASLLNHPS